MTIFSLILVTMIGLTTRRPGRQITGFPAAAGPRFSGDYARAPAPAGEPFKVISWNIKLGAGVETAISELQAVDVLQDAAVLLLQEMDEGGVEQMARVLGYNYVYYPASRDNGRGRNLGNAVLSKWPILETLKIVLPHPSPTNQERRIAVGALLDVGGEPLAVYSVHTELPILTAGQRRAQFRHLAEAIAAATAGCAILGGDFNTPGAGSIALVDETMATAGLKPVVEKRVPTLKLGWLGFTLDHLYSSGATPLRTGVWRETAASDHFPIWAELESCVQQAPRWRESADASMLIGKRSGSGIPE